MCLSFLYFSSILIFFCFAESISWIKCSIEVWKISPGSYCHLVGHLLHLLLGVCHLQIHLYIEGCCLLCQSSTLFAQPAVNFPDLRDTMLCWALHSTFIMSSSPMFALCPSLPFSLNYTSFKTINMYQRCCIYDKVCNKLDI